MSSCKAAGKRVEKGSEQGQFYRVYGKMPRHVGSNDHFTFDINNEMLLRDSTVVNHSILN